MSIHDKAAFQAVFKKHYDNLKPALYIWEKNSEFEDGNERTTYTKQFTITSTTPYSFVINNAANYVCNHNHQNSRQCAPDMVKCPIEHMLVIHNTTTSETHTVFDFQPMSVRATDKSDRHGKNIMKFRADYGIFDANYHNNGKFKQGKMKQIDVYHPRYHLP